MLANLEIGLHEQTRLQPEIREALDAAYATQEDLGTACARGAVPVGGALVAGRPAPGRAPSSAWSRQRVQRAASALAREVITDSFMVLSLPGRVLALGTHLDDAVPGGARASPPTRS